MECVEARTALHAYLDRELDAVNAREFETHLAACPQCRHGYDQQQRLKQAIREQADYYAPPAGWAERVRAATVRAPSRERRTGGWGWQWLQLGTAVALSAVVTWIVALQYGVPSTTDRLEEEVITGHARATLTGHLTEVASSDQHTVKPWLSSKLDFSPPVTDLVTTGFPLAGGRLDYLDNRPVAVLVYHRRQHVIDLFVWPEAGARAAEPTRAVSKQGYNMVHWSRDGMTFWAISDVNPNDLNTFAKLYVAAR
jgi:anti-sigma factor (TIGR02949 family)